MLENPQVKSVRNKTGKPVLCAFTTEFKPTPTKATADTGCTVTAMGTSIYASCFGDKEIDTTRARSLEGASAVFQTLGTIDSTISFTGTGIDGKPRTFTKPITIQVSEDMLPTDFLIGTDFLERAKAIINLGTGKITFPTPKGPVIVQTRKLKSQ